ncbi:hypothetical protein GLOIN_2v1762049 [Rhizophagus irregularis DAOM 181602=DAOM 197198]|nr:hypothetical protein GLOIN_2v1762049 [Rhizophagus irregularis DAOM 181602=DAOM 197198]
MPPKGNKKSGNNPNGDLPSVKTNETKIKTLALTFQTLIMNKQTIKPTLSNVPVRSQKILWKKTIYYCAFCAWFCCVWYRRIHACSKRQRNFPLDASPNKDIMDTNDTSPLPLDTPTISILRRDFQAAAAPNTSPDFQL